VAAPALANAIYAVTGKSIREIPFINLLILYSAIDSNKKIKV
jgi:CO/xanthine dehydrogenase Mo-binding subunit